MRASAPQSGRRGALSQRALEAPLAHETPRTDRIGNDVDVYEHVRTIVG
jgi:hypothetical protein